MIVPSTSKTWPEVISAVFYSDEAHRVHMGVCAATLFLLCKVLVELLMRKHMHAFSRYLFLSNSNCNIERASFCTKPAEMFYLHIFVSKYLRITIFQHFFLMKAVILRTSEICFLCCLGFKVAFAAVLFSLTEPNPEAFNLPVRFFGDGLNAVQACVEYRRNFEGFVFLPG